MQVIKPGQSYNRWTVVSEASARRGHRYWLCRCSCGTVKEVCGRSLTVAKNGSKSCGCLNLEVASNRFKTHGVSETSYYNVWANMRQRCNDQNVNNFHRYGGRGIKVCQRWDSFEAFREDMGPRPTPSHQIDRIDTNGNYEPSNCRWVTRTENMRNRGDARPVVVDGQSKCVSAWCEHFGSVVRPSTARTRLVNGWDPKVAFSTPPRHGYWRSEYAKR